MVRSLMFTLPSRLASPGSTGVNKKAWDRARVGPVPDDVASVVDAVGILQGPTGGGTWREHVCQVLHAAGVSPDKSMIGATAGLGVADDHIAVVDRPRRVGWDAGSQLPK